MYAQTKTITNIFLCLCLNTIFVWSQQTGNWPTTNWEIHCDPEMNKYANLTETTLQEMLGYHTITFNNLKKLTWEEAANVLQASPKELEKAQNKVAGSLHPPSPAIALLMVQYADYYISECQANEVAADKLSGEQGSAEQLRANLRIASRWLEKLNFEAPRLKKYKIREENDQTDYIYRAYVTDNNSKKHTNLGTYDPNTDKLYIQALTYFYLADVKTDTIKVPKYNGYFLEETIESQGNIDQISACAHELFHAIQAAYQGSSYYHPKFEYDWLMEGSAEAVGLSFMQHHVFNGKLTDEVKQFLFKEDRAYDYPLHQPKKDKNLLNDNYKTRSFFYLTGEALQSEANVAYLDQILQQKITTRYGLSTLHKGLQKWHPNGLAYYYPEFIRRRYFAPHHISDYKLFNNAAFEKTHTESFTYQNKRLKKDFKHKGSVRKVATESYWVNIKAPAGSAVAVKIYLETDHPDLHLIVDNQRLDMPTNQQERNVFRGALYQSESELFVRVANIAKNVEQSNKQSYQLIIELDELDLCEGTYMIDMLSPESESLMKNELPFMDDQTAAISGSSLGVLLPIETYKEKFEQPAGLHPGKATLFFSGLISDGGTACVDHIGSNPAFDFTGNEGLSFNESDFNLGSIEEEEGYENMSEADILKQMQEFSQGMDILEGFLTGGNNTLFQIYSPNPFSWQWGVMGSSTAIMHGGFGGWKQNATGIIGILLKGTNPKELEVGQNYPAELVYSDQDDSDSFTELYSRWKGEFISPENYPSRYKPEQPVFNGRTHILSTGKLNGSVKIEDITPAMVKGSFSLSGPAKLIVDIDEIIVTKDGIAAGPDNGVEERKGGITVSGTFQAPAIVEHQRMGRLIMHTKRAR